MARRDLKLDSPPQPRTTSTLSSSRPQPGRRRGQNRTETAGSTASLLPDRTQHQPDDLPSTFSPSKRESLERADSRATMRESTQPTSSALRDGSYNSSGYNTARHSEAPTYGPYDPTTDGYSTYGSNGAPPSFPPRNPPIPPKRPTEVDTDASSEHRTKGQGIFSGKFRKS